MTSPSEPTPPEPTPGFPPPVASVPPSPVSAATPVAVAPAEPVTKPRARPFRTVGRITLSLALGLLVGVVLHYLIYRLSLPSKPFIYVAF